MKLESSRFKANGAGDITTSVKVLDDAGVLLFSDVVNLSNARSRAVFITEVASRAKVSRDRAERAVLRLLEEANSEVNAEIPEEKRERKADKLVRLVLEQGVDLFHDQYGETYCRLPVHGRYQVHRIGSQGFRQRVTQMSYEQAMETPSSETLRSGLLVLQGKASFDGPQHHLGVRVARHKDEIFYDLGNWTAIAIGPDGWRRVPDPPPLFRAYPHQGLQVMPETGGNLADILRFINIPNEGQQCLLMAHLVAGLVPDIPRAGLVLHGPHGSAKTTAFNLVRELLDPTEIPVSAPPREVGEFVQAAHSSLCVFLDNLSTLPIWLSDALARCVTGDGFLKRKLFTDDDSVVYKSQGLVGINGVNLVVSALDLLDRSLIFGLSRVPDGLRKTEESIKQEFQALKPRLLGAMFTALSKAMKIRPTLEPRKLPRLADYGLWACAAAVALGYTAADYWKALTANTGARVREALEASPVACAVMEVMQECSLWEGTPSELLALLNWVAERERIDTKSKAWPKDAYWVTRCLTEVLPALADIGIHVSEGRDEKNRWVRLQGSGNGVTAVMATHAQIEPSDTNDGDDSILPTPRANPLINSEVHGQIRRSVPSDPCICDPIPGPAVQGERCADCAAKDRRCSDCGGCRCAQGVSQ